MRIDRLRELVALLRRRGGTVGAQELARRFGVSVRTIQRDIDALLRAGVPLRVTRGMRGGVSLDADASTVSLTENASLVRGEQRRWHALVLLSPAAAEASGEAGLLSLPEGERLVSREFCDYGEMLRWAWALGDGARVLEPDALRADIAERARRLLDTYGKAGGR